MVAGGGRRGNQLFTQVGYMAIITHKNSALALRYVVAASAVVALSACAVFSRQDPAPADGGAWLPSGSIVISSPIPQACTPAPLRMLGFLPTRLSQQTFWLAIDKEAGTLSLMQGEKNVFTAEAEGTERLQPGVYSLLHKQRDPLWHAPDSYFTTRHLPVPPEGDRSRFRRGALGEMVLYLNQDTPIHGGIVWSEEVGGLRLDVDELTRLYTEVGVGAPIEIR
jgi:hypothetical protein